MNLQILNSCAGTDPELPTAETYPGLRYFVKFVDSSPMNALPCLELRLILTYQMVIIFVLIFKEHPILFIDAKYFVCTIMLTDLLYLCRSLAT